MKPQLDKIRSEDAKREYEKVQVIVKNYVKSLQPQNVETS